ncbi:SemiSWEET transporter [Leeia sp. TBRC 13508]|uniref:SemiSWEET transporter n=1 Tax=Leeia speluncae TaxID=2884804 RepID=A0ABS8D913_9NEIS|nr:SemiSWEET transporter [Leeia speluncae]MCB6184700.1 SemiSWEET transporter [Leeia speluncae]
MDYFGYVAAFLTTICWIPQVIHTYRTRELAGISLVMYIILVSGLICWVIYGALMNALPILIANTITVILAASILALKIRSVIHAKRLKA